MPLLEGRKPIADYLDCCWKTVTTRQRKYGLPIRRYPNRRPCLFTEEYELWVRFYDERVREEREERKNRPEGWSRKTGATPETEEKRDGLPEGMRPGKG